MSTCKSTVTENKAYLARASATTYPKNDKLRQSTSYHQMPLTYVKATFQPTPDPIFNLLQSQDMDVRSPSIPLVSEGRG